MHDALFNLAAQDIGRVSFDEPLAEHCSWRIGGPADLLVEPETIAQISRVRRFLEGLEIPLVVIGQGSNLLFDDAGVRGVVMKIGQRLAGVDIRDTEIYAEAGIWVPQLARLSMRAGLSGLEHCIGIPGTLGGLVQMNGGSQRRAIGDNVSAVEVVERGGEISRLTADQCGFDYRQSALQGSDRIVVAVELSCPRGDRGEIRRQMLADLRERRGKFPRKQPNCGSVFLSSAQMHATVGPPGRIIEQCGLKGTTLGAAEVSSQHANFILNRGGATAAEVLQLIALIRRRVWQQIDFELACEVRYVSPAGEIIPAHRVAGRIS